MLFLLAEPPRWNGGRSMGAVKGNLSHSSKKRCCELKGARATRALVRPREKLEERSSFDASN